MVPVVAVCNPNAALETAAVVAAASSIQALVDAKFKDSELVGDIDDHLDTLLSDLITKRFLALIQYLLDPDLLIQASNRSVEIFEITTDRLRRFAVKPEFSQMNGIKFED